MAVIALVGISVASAWRLGRCQAGVMTKFHLRTGSASYQRDRQLFLKELKQFHDSRGTAIRNLPVVNGKEIDLYLLYMLVTHHGGWVKVNGQGLWDNTLKQLGMPTSCVNGGVAIRQVYLRYLERWERIKGGGAGGIQGGGGDMDASLAEVDDDRPRRSAWGTPRARNTVALTYNHTQHNVPDHVRECNGLPPLQRLGGAMERMALSLLSPLPNEQDFALNVCTILAADSANKLPIISSPYIVDFLLGHAAIYNHPSLRDVIGKSYKEARTCNIEWFWLEHTRPSGTLELLDEERFPIQGLAMQAIVSQLNLKNYLADDGTILPADDKELPVFEGLSAAMLADEDGILASRCSGGARDLITRRISQVASIMRNLSFHEDNIPVLAKHQTFLRFLLLCVNCTMSSIRQSGLDSLGNIAVELAIKDPATCLLSRHLLSTLTAALHSDDRARALATLEILNKLAQNESNEDVLLRCLEQKVYEQVCSYLTLHDIMLLVVTLECMYALTTLGEKSCDYIVKIHGVVDTLVSLITVEAQSYGPKACILMRVVETVSGTNLPSNSVPGNNPNMPTQATPATPPPLQTVNTSQTSTLLQIAGSRSDVNSNTTPPPLVQPNSLSVQQQHAHQQIIQENEQFALAWLRATWEPCPSNIKLDASELYKQYLACCNKVGRKGVISPLHFPRCVRSVFGGVVGPNPVKGPSGELMQFYSGVRQKPQQTKPGQPNIKNGPASPILKAQLSKVEQIKSQINHNSQLSQALADTPKSPPLLQITPSSVSAPLLNLPPPSQQSSNTTLIKHLLAHKVSAAPTIGSGVADRMDRMQMQVTQRQNQQKMMGQMTPTINSIPISSPNPMEIDAEALISCSTITSSGVTSTTPQQMPNIKVTTTIPQQQELSGGIVESQTITDENSIKNANPMLSTLVEKKPVPPNSINQGLRSRNSTEDDEPANKKARFEEGVSSTAANLYAALAASALEDEEDLLLAQSEAAAQQNNVPPPPVVQPEPTVQPPVAPVEQVVIPTPQQISIPEVQDSDPMRQVIVSQMPNQQGQLILHANNGKPVVGVSNTQFVPPLHMISAQNTQQGIGFAQGGVMPHKTIIILQGGSTNGPITLTVNNSAGLDENTLNNLITQATDAISQQQSLSLSQATNAVIQTSAGVIQTTQGMMQPTQTIIQTNQGMISGPQGILNSAGVIKQQIVQGQAQLVPSQQPIITQQPQPQIISAGHQVITSQANQQVIVQSSQPQQFSQVIAGNQQIIVGSQGLITGPPQLMVGNQQILMGNQQLIGTPQLIAGGQQFMSVAGGQQRLISGNQIIVDQQGNRQILAGNQNIVITGQQQTVNVNQSIKTDLKKPIINNTQNNQVNIAPQKINFTNAQFPNTTTGYQQDNQQNSTIQSPTRNVQNNTKTITGNDNIVQQPAKPPPPVSPRKIPDEPWVCLWKGCDTVFESASAVYIHACNTHCTRAESPCMWLYCDQLPRRRFSLMTHLQDRHCSFDALKASLTQRRKGIVPAVTTAPVQIPTPSTMERIDSPGSDSQGTSSHPGYAPNAALHAIKRHAVDFLNPRELMQRAEASRNTVETPDDNEGPVTKSIRLTAALILRNIVIYSHIGRRLLRGYEPHLAGIALSSVEASRTVAQVLYDMNCI